MRLSLRTCLSANLFLIFNLWGLAADYPETVAVLKGAPSLSEATMTVVGLVKYRMA